MLTHVSCLSREREAGFSCASLEPVSHGHFWLTSVFVSAGSALGLLYNTSFSANSLRGAAEDEVLLFKLGLHAWGWNCKPPRGFLRRKRTTFGTSPP